MPSPTGWRVGPPRTGSSSATRVRMIVVMDSGDGTDTQVGPMTDEEYFWEPVPGCWSVRWRADGPGPRATLLAGTGDWGRDAAPYPHPWPPPFTTIAWRLSHLSEMLTLRADHTAGSHALTRDVCPVSGDVTGAVAALDTVGYCTYPHGSDADEPFIDVVWWVNQELLHHGAEIALIRDLYRAGQR
ncbi:DinB family protein [Streptomyces mirabilis]|uniref:DinB family protein n=1 Tax=Streptomyces sp. GbtcB7 TaxID=2824752 RepID=UPI0027E49D36|nr:DinB family protein [Streptomyces sp. GbtcB7]